jgi:hypothetical protein
MNNDLVNELSNYRAERLYRTDDDTVTRLVIKAVEQVMPGALNGLQGIDAERDGVTHDMWRQALSSAEMDGSLTFPQYHHSGEAIPADAEPVSWELAQNVIAGRVARAILVLNGYTQ